MYDNLLGRRFCRWLVLKFSHRTKDGRTYWLCRCDCGNSKSVRGSHLISTASRSCGCLKAESTSKRARTHGATVGGELEPLYVVWCSMKQRCYDSGCRAYKDYGGRGIVLSENWMEYQSFKDDMKYGYKKGLQIDRVDNNGNYCKENCRWSTPRQNCNNRRNSIFLRFQGINKTIAQWSRKLKMNDKTLYLRYSKGWSTKRILNTTLWSR